MDQVGDETFLKELIDLFQRKTMLFDIEQRFQIIRDLFGRGTGMDLVRTEFFSGFQGHQ
jgi:hypothetical protein